MKLFARVAKPKRSSPCSKAASYLGPITRAKAKAREVVDEPPSCSYHHQEASSSQSSETGEHAKFLSQDESSYELVEVEDTTTATAGERATTEEEISEIYAGRRKRARRRSLAEEEDAPAADRITITNFLDRLNDKLSARQEEASRRYNFDFEAGTPLEGKIKWSSA